MDAHLDIVQGNMDNLISMETGNGGSFLVTGLDFMDSLNFAFKPTNSKGKLSGNINLLERDKPAFTYKQPKLQLKYEADNALQRVQNTYDLDKNTILLQEVVVTDKATETEPKGMPKLYGQPDYVVKGSDIRGVTAGVNLLIGLQGRVPGIQVTEYFDEIGMRHVRVKIRGGTSSIAGDTDPLILVDGIPWGSPDDLMAVSPSVIDHVEVITRSVAQFGSRGANGVIAVYTKRSIDAIDTPKDYVSYKMGGYSRPLNFKHPDYSKNETEVTTDFRTTIYWNPSIPTGGAPATVEFFAADLETKYRVVIEGISYEGKPIRGEAFINVVP
jgi:hypothetical protein